MPPLAIAGVAAVASIGGAAISAHSSNKAAKRAEQTQLTVANQNNALVRENRDYLAQRLDPFVQSGLRGSNLIDSFLYGPQQSAPQATYAPATPQTYSGGGYQPNALAPGGFANNIPIGNGADSWSPESGYSGGSFGTYDGYGGTQPVQGAVTTQAPQNPQGGWDAFVSSPYYQFPLAEGYRGLNQQYAGIGALNSGAAVKSALKFGQNYGAGRLDEFLGMAGQQANRGLSAGSALGGVSQNALAMTTQNNQNAADASANAALLRAQNNNNMYGGIANALGSFASSFAPRGF